MDTLFSRFGQRDSSTDLRERSKTTSHSALVDEARRHMSEAMVTQLKGWNSGSDTAHLGLKERFGQARAFMRVRTAPRLVMCLTGYVLCFSGTPWLEETHTRSEWPTITTEMATAKL